MSQSAQSISNGTGAAVRAAINTALAALFSTNSGPSAPSTTVAHQFWADTTLGLLWRRNAANTGWMLYSTLTETTVNARSSNTIIGLADKEKVFLVTSTFTQTFEACTILKDSWYIDYKNVGAGIITLTPGSGTIDGLSSLALPPGAAIRIWCNGTNLFTFGLYTGIFASLGSAQTFTAAQRGTPVSLPQAATITPDFGLANFFYTTMTGNNTLGTPSNKTAGQSGSIEIIQDGTGSRTLAYHADWLFPGGTDPVLSTAPGAIDVLCYQVNQAGTKIYANLMKGLA